MVTDTIDTHRRTKARHSRPVRRPRLLLAMSTTIHDLPLEIIQRIMRTAYPVYCLHHTQLSESQQFFFNASLVCRGWRLFAQAELWSFVNVSSKNMAQFSAAGPGLSPVKILQIEEVEDADPSVLESILCNVRGVECLYIEGGTIESSWLCHPVQEGRGERRRVQVHPSLASSRSRSSVWRTNFPAHSSASPRHGLLPASPARGRSRNRLCSISLCWTSNFTELFLGDYVLCRPLSLAFPPHPRLPNLLYRARRPQPHTSELPPALSHPP